MKAILLAATVFSAAVATPTLAQTINDQGRGAYNSEPSYGYSDRFYTQRNRGNVYSTRGHYLGTDPDPTVRQQLQRDPSQGD